MRFKIPAKQPGSFKNTARYLAGLTKGVTPERVEWVFATNLQTTDPEAAAAIMDATASRSTRCQKPAYHFIITFDPADKAAGKIDAQTMRAIANDVIARMGLKDYQGLVYAHRDTPHPHIHFLVNRVHPELAKAFNRHEDGKRLTALCREIARQRGLNIAKDHTRMKEFGQVLDVVPDQPRPATDGEYWNAQREQRVPNQRFNREQTFYLARDLRPVFDRATEWDELNEVLKERGLTMMAKGQGLVVTNGDRYLKLSDLGKGVRLPELEKRFKERFADFSAREAERLREKFEREQLLDHPASLPPPERARAERIHRAKVRAARDAMDPIIRLDDADMEHRYWTHIEHGYQRGARRVTAAEKREAQLTRQEQSAAERLKERDAQFNDTMDRTYRNPEGAKGAWLRLEKDIGVAEAAALVQSNPFVLGLTKGGGLFGSAAEARKEAEKALKLLVKQRRQFLDARHKLGDTWAKMKHAQHNLALARRDYDMLQKSAGTPEQLRAMVVERIKDRVRALERVSGKMIEKSNLADERKEQLYRALRLHRERRRELSKTRERGHALGLDMEYFDD